MRVPNFAAESSLRPRQGHYRTTRAQGQQGSGLAMAAIGLGGRLGAYGPAGRVFGASFGYDCAGLECSCRGDADCDDMFRRAGCGDIASCTVTDSGDVTCRCLRI